MFPWARVLERFIAEDTDGAREMLGQARQRNPHVETYLIGEKRMPKQLPPHYGLGDEYEAQGCIDAIGGAWRKHLAAMRWLRDEA